MDKKGLLILQYFIPTSYYINASMLLTRSEIYYLQFDATICEPIHSQKRPLKSQYYYFYKGALFRGYGGPPVLE